MVCLWISPFEVTRQRDSETFPHGTERGCVDGMSCSFVKQWRQLLRHFWTRLTLYQVEVPSGAMQCALISSTGTFAQTASDTSQFAAMLSKCQMTTRFQCLGGRLP